MKNYTTTDTRSFQEKKKDTNKFLGMQEPNRRSSKDKSDFGKLNLGMDAHTCVLPATFFYTEPEP